MKLFSTDEYYSATMDTRNLLLLTIVWLQSGILFSITKGLDLLRPEYSDSLLQTAMTSLSLLVFLLTPVMLVAGFLLE
jgi:hypothetical protein